MDVKLQQEVKTKENIDYLYAQALRRDNGWQAEHSLQVI